MALHLKQNFACRRASTWLALPTIVALSLGATGCGGGPPATVEGVVRLNGKPLDRGSVTFVPVEGGAGATASIGSGGAYAARTGSLEGLEPGEYVVTVQARGDVIRNAKGGLPMPGKLLTPAKYTTSKTSDLRATIKPGSNELDLELRGNGA